MTRKPAVPTSQTVEYIVVAYRSEKHLTDCLDAIEADRPPGAAITVVDNASPDHSAAVAMAHRSKPRLVNSPRNLGFGGGCNLGVDARSAEFVFFVNPDARLRPGATAGLLAQLRRDPTIAAAGPRMIDSAGVIGAASAGFEPTLRSALGHFLLLARLAVLRSLFPPFQLPPGSASRRVDWVGGAAMMVRTADFRRVGGFDPSMFLYMEDVDLCRRLREAGSAVLYEPAAVVAHDMGGSQGDEQPARWYRAFHAYVARRRGKPYARLVSTIAFLGLGLRASLLALQDRRRARRLARAALTAAREALRIGTARALDTPGP